VLVLLFALPLAILLSRPTGLPAAAALHQHASFATLPAGLRGHVTVLMFVPIGSLVVVLFRLTLGLRAFGVFSPILIALALASTGYLVALSFLLLVMVIIAVIVRPMLKAQRLPYAARVSVLSSTVVLLMLGLTLLGQNWHAQRLISVSYFPIIAVCLVAERFAASLSREGTAVAARRTAITVVEALVIAVLAGPLHGAALLLRYPELVLVLIGLTVLTGTHLNRRLFEPPPPPRRQRSRPSTVAQGERQAS
jgi:hypothetical protein